MSKIEMMEVNQHTSDEVAKVLADLEAQGVDLAAIRTAMEGGGNSGKTVKGIQSGIVPYSGSVKTYVSSPKMGGEERTFYKDVTIKSVVPENCIVFVWPWSDKNYPSVITSATNLRVYVGSYNTSTTGISLYGFTYAIVEFA